MDEALAMTVYSLLFTLALVLSSPVWLFRMVKGGRYRQGLLERLGFVQPALGQAVRGRPAIWIHAVSVGEVLSAERLIRELRRALPDRVFALSTTTPTGQAVARDRFPDLPIFFFPLDFAFAVRACLRTLNPQLLILVEGELWPRLLCECARAGLPVAVVNARVSDRSFRRTYPLRSLWLPMARKITLFLAQSHETAERLRLLGVAETSIQTPGNLKRDPIPANGGAPPNRMARRIADSIGEARLLVCGSTHEGEEAILLAAWPTIQRELPDAMLLLAPRHPQRFTAVRALVEATGAPVLCCSQLLASQLPAGSTPIPPGTVLLLDTLGDLADVYGIASAAFIGGSLVARGGHNPLEATRFTLPVFLGPSFENFREVVRDLIAARELEVVTADTLAPRLVSALRSGKAEIPAAAQTGATSRTVQALLRLLEDSGRRPRPETRA